MTAISTSLLLAGMRYVHLICVQGMNVPRFAEAEGPAEGRDKGAKEQQPLTRATQTALPGAFASKHRIGASRVAATGRLVLGRGTPWMPRCSHEQMRHEQAC